MICPSNTADSLPFILEVCLVVSNYPNSISERGPSSYSLKNKEWLHHVRMKAHGDWNGQYGPVSVGRTHSQVIQSAPILFQKDTKQQHEEEEAFCTPCTRGTTETAVLHRQIPNKHNSASIHTHIKINLKNRWISPSLSLTHTHTAPNNSSLIAQLFYKGHPGVAAFRSWPQSLPWWSPASLMSPCLVSAY